MPEFKVIEKSLVRKQPYSDMEYGKLPPQAIDMEEAVLSAILIDHDAFGLIIRILKGDDYFYHPSYQTIYGAMIALWIENEPIDILTVTDKLRSMGLLDQVGGPYFIAQLSNRIGSSAHSESHARIIKEKWVMRKLIEVSSTIQSQSYDDTSDCFSVLEKGMMELSNVLNDVSSSGDKNLNSFIDELDRNIRDASNHTGADKFIIGHSFGNYDLDRMTLGLCAPDLVLLAGRPGEGKTTLMLQSARENAMKGISVGIFSLEMSGIQLLQKIYAMETGIDLHKLRTGSMDAHEWLIYEEARDRVRSWPLHICDKGSISISEIKAISSGWVAQYGVKDIYVDYLQLITLGDVARVNSREQEIGYISRNLKALAKDLHVPVVALSQMSRAIEDRAKADKLPKNSDLRDSGSLEQDADIIIFVFRPDTHGITQLEDGESTENMTMFIVSKSRMGPKGDIRATFEGRYSRFV